MIELIGKTKDIGLINNPKNNITFNGKRYKVIVDCDDYDRNAYNVMWVNLMGAYAFELDFKTMQALWCHKGKVEESYSFNMDGGVFSFNNWNAFKSISNDGELERVIRDYLADNFEVMED